MHFNILYDFPLGFPCFIFTNCNACFFLWFFPNDKMPLFSFHHHRLSHPMTLNLQTILIHHFPIDGEYYINHICFSYNRTLRYKKIFLQNRLDLLEALVLMTCWSFFQSDRHFHIPRTSKRIQEASLFQTYCLSLLKNFYSFEKENFFTKLSWKLAFSFWKPTISFSLTVSSMSLSFHNKYYFWTYWGFPSTFLI